MKDLRRERRVRRAHFLPALLLAAVVVIGVLVSVEVRPDLLQQPAGQLVLQAALWVMCLLVLPAVGVGLLFPGRWTRVLLATSAILLAASASTGWPLAGLEHGGESGEDACMMLVLGTGVMLVLIGFLSGAFVERRGMASVFWVAAGLALVALNVVTWHCPASGMWHVLPGHLGGAVLLMAVAVVVGLLSRRKREGSEGSTR